MIPSLAICCGEGAARLSGPGGGRVAQQAFGKYGIDAEAVLRDLPQWPWGAGRGYQAVRTVPAAAGNAAPDIEARTVLTVYGLCHARDGADHPLVRVFLRAVEVAAGRQGGITLNPLEAKPITLASADLVGARPPSCVFSWSTTGLGNWAGGARTAVGDLAVVPGGSTTSPASWFLL